MISILEKIKKKDLLFKFKIGLERETLRINKKGHLSTKSHPPLLGSPLINPYFTLDFGEAQLEWNTPPFASLTHAHHFLKEIMAYAAQVNPQELFWPYSMPCPLINSIQMARFGSSFEAKQKELYRKGLCYRYGKKLQMISSLHFNFSFTKPFWDFLYDIKNPKVPKQIFINNSYFNLIRNFLCEGWILTYLFGASPAAHASYFENKPKGLEKLNDALILPHATSLRMSSYGYYSRIQNQLAISFNDYESYVRDIKRAISTPYKEYQKIGVYHKNEQIQINDHYLQIENEHYARIRPKANPDLGESSLEALIRQGVEYVEVRSIDVNPFIPIGIGKEQFIFLHQFLLYSLLQPPFTLDETCRLNLVNNQQLVSLKGRQKDLVLTCQKPLTLKEWAQKILKKMAPLAELLDHPKDRGYMKNLLLQQSKIDDPSLTPSASILEEIKSTGYEAFGLKWAKKHSKAFQPVSKRKEMHFKKTTEISLKKKQALETAAHFLTQGYEDMELSTQILIKKALQLQIDVKVLDRKENLIRLKKGSHIEYVKEATKTSKDSYIAPLLMENKQVTKDLLSEKGFFVPEGVTFTSQLEAIENYSTFSKRKTVVKPLLTNFGVGITIVDQNDSEGYEKAVREAFYHGSTILVEHFCKGNEYRFLVIDDRIIGVVHRMPAHVIGNGVSTVKELIEQKNHDPCFYRSPKTYLRLSKVEKKHLSKLNLKADSIPKKNHVVFLRTNSNVSTGGDAHDMTDEVDRSYKQLAINAAKSVQAKVCGVDMLIPSPRKKAEQGGYTILELNFNPVLFFHAFPNKGKKRDVATPLLKLLQFSSK